MKKLLSKEKELHKEPTEKLPVFMQVIGIGLIVIGLLMFLLLIYAMIIFAMNTTL